LPPLKDEESLGKEIGRFSAFSFMNLRRKIFFSNIVGIFYRTISSSDQLLGGKLTGIVIALFAARIWI